MSVLWLNKLHFSSLTVTLSFCIWTITLTTSEFTVYNVYCIGIRTVQYCILYITFELYCTVRLYCTYSTVQYMFNLSFHMNMYTVQYMYANTQILSIKCVHYCNVEYAVPAKVAVWRRIYCTRYVVLYVQYMYQCTMRNAAEKSTFLSTAVHVRYGGTRLEAHSWRC